MILRALIAISIQGCGFAPGARAVIDASGDAERDAAMPDTLFLDAARDCLAKWETGPGPMLSAPVRLAELSGGTYDRDPFVTPDELTLYWSSQRAGDSVPHIYRATRAHWADPFGDIAAVAELDSAGFDGKMSMTSDGEDAVLASNRAGHVGAMTNFDVWEATRPSGQGTFGPVSEAELIPDVDSASDQLDPALSWDGLTLYWADSISGHQQVIVASRASRTSPFMNTSIALGNAMDVADPAISRDGRVLLYTANVTSDATDIVYVTRSSTSGTFGAPTALTAIDTTSFEGDAFLSYDACDVFFASTQQSPNVFQLFVSHVQ